MQLKFIYSEKIILAKRWDTNTCTWILTEILVCQMKSDFFCVAFSHYMNITVVSKLCDAQIGEEIMKEFFVIHSITHHPTRKKKTTRQTENHSQFFRRSSIYTPVHILLQFFYFFDGFKSWINESINELNVLAIIFWCSSDPSKGCSQSTLTRGDILTTV